MLLPSSGETAVNLVAIDGRHRLIVGAASATRSLRRQPLVGPGVSVQVIEPCRRHGIGRALVAQLARAAQAGGATALYGAKRVDAGGHEQRGWEHLGFAACEVVEQHLLPLREFEPRLAPLVERMREQGRIPSSASIIPLYQAELPAVLQLHLDNMGGDRRDLYWRLRGQASDAFMPRHSRVLLVDNKVKGCILGHRINADTIAVDANIVDPSIRGTWANVWLKLEATRGAMRLGIKNFRFTTFDHYTDTRSFTKKLGGTTIHSSLLMFRPLSGKTSR
jgi:hypothetical protein